MDAAGATWEDVIARYDLRVRFGGGHYRGPCPLHGGSNPTSFVITPGRGFYCHACGCGGGIATFVTLMKDPSRALAGGRASLAAHRTPRLLDLDRYAEGRHHALATLPEVRAIGPLNPRHPYLRSRGVTCETARRFGCGYLAGGSAFGGRVVFPVRTPDGRLVGHVGRAADGTAPRYRFQRGFRRGLLLLHEEATSITEPLVVVEGPFDALAVSQAGFPNVVALLGCRATGHQLAPLAWYSRVIVLLDGDGAGRDGAAWIRTQLGKQAVPVALAGDPGETDPGTLSRLLCAAGAIRASVQS